MTWREAIVVSILLLVARMFAEDDALESEIKNLANRISVEARRTTS